MNFNEFLNLNESTLLDLYKSTVDAFPKTTKRQNSIDMIKIIEMNYTPYIGMKTLFVKGMAKNIDNQKEYDSIILFKNINYAKAKNESIVELIASNNKKYYIERINPYLNEVVVRCSCPDFHWRFNYYNSLDKSLYGRKRKKYESRTNAMKANVNEAEGMCKHLIKLVKAIKDSKLMED